MVCWRNGPEDAELQRDLKTLATFVLVYCRHKHHDAMKGPVRLSTTAPDRLKRGCDLSR